MWTGAASLALTASVAAFAVAQAPATKAPAKAPAKTAAAAASAPAAATAESNLISAEEAKKPLQPGGVDEEGLGQMVNALGLKPEYRFCG